MQGCDVIQQQMNALRRVGLINVAQEFTIGINGGAESRGAACVLLPKEAKKVFHGLESHSENLTLVELEKWLPDHPGWNVLYFHAKGVTHPEQSEMVTRWRGCMMHHLIENWLTCVSSLEVGYEAIGCHWMQYPLTPQGQHIFAGNFWWATSDYLRTLPSILDTPRIKESGVGSLESRYEAEVWLCGGKRLPRYKDYHGPGWHPGMVKNCVC